MRFPQFRLQAATTLTALCCAGCSVTAPTRANVTGRWLGSTMVGAEQWNLDMTLTDQESIRGRATLTSVPARVNNDMAVTGSVSGDSVRLLLRPIEDADIHVVAGISAIRLDGRLWLNDFTNDPHAISFVRQPAR